MEVIRSCSCAHLFGQIRLVAYSRGHAAQESRDLRAGLGEAEDVVDEQEHVAVLDIPEVLRDGEPGERHPEPRARRLVHLAEDHGQLVQHSGAGHLLIEVVALASSLTHTGKDRETAADLLGDVVDQLLNDDGLAGAGAAEGADLTAAHEGGDQVDDLDTSLQHFGLGCLIFQSGSRSMDRQARRVGRRRLVVYGLAKHVEDTTQGERADWYRNGAAGVEGFLAATHAVGRAHADAADDVVAQQLLDLKRSAAALVHSLVLRVHCR